VRHQSATFLDSIYNFIWQAIATGFGVSIEDVQTAFGNVAGFQPAPTTEFTILNDSAIFGGELVLLPILDKLTEYPEDEPRACEYQESACMNADPELKRAELWSTNGLVEFFSGGGVTLNPGSTISMQLSLDPETQYQVETWARSMGTGSANYSVQLGQTFESFEVGQDYQQSIIAATIHTPDLGLFYTFAISNAGTAPAASMSSAKPRTSRHRAVGGRTRRSVARAMTAHVPSVPTSALAMSGPRSPSSQSSA